MSDQKKQLTVVSENLSNLIEEKIDACPKGFNRTRFLQNCLTVLTEIDQVKLSKCSPESIALTMIKGAFLGLDFFNKECYAIPFGNELQFMVDYKGNIKLARQYAVKPVKSIYAKLVRKGDFFESNVIDGNPVVNFKPIDFSDAEITGAFAVVIYDDLSMEHAIMSKKEIETTRRNYSKCSNSPAWVKSFGEMAKKTVLHRLCKMIELNFDNAEQDKAFQAGEDLNANAIDISPEKTEVKDPFKKEIPQDIPAKPVDKEQQILKVQSEIEKYLVTTKKSPSLVYKYAVDVYSKKLIDLNLAEIVALKEKIIGGKI